MIVFQYNLQINASCLKTVVTVAICLLNISMIDKTASANNLCTVVVEVMTTALILNKNVNDSVSKHKVINVIVIVRIVAIV